VCSRHNGGRKGEGIGTTNGGVETSAVGYRLHIEGTESDNVFVHAGDRILRKGISIHAPYER
jgi:hypothetical protein